MRTWSWGSRRCWLRDSASLRKVSGGLRCWGGTEGQPHTQSAVLDQTMMGALL